MNESVRRMGKPGKELWTLVIILSSIVGLNDAIRCLSCDHVSSPLDCNQIRTCESYEECVTEQKVSASGIQYYRLGCEPKVNCGSGGSSAVIGKKREQENNITERNLDGDLTACSHCCNSSDGCNVKLCTTKTSRYLRCLQCDNVLSPDDCQDLAVCWDNEHCFLNDGHITFNGEMRVSMGCMRQQQCNAIMQATSNHCVRCCSNDYCNYDACKNYTTPSYRTYTQARTSKPSTKSTTILITKPTTNARPTTRAPLHRPGATCVKSPITTTFVINCHVTGNPPPTAHWTFYDPVHSVPRYTFDNDPDIAFHHNLTNYVLYVSHYDPLRHNGNWYLHLSNAMGNKLVYTRIP